MKHLIPMISIFSLIFVSLPTARAQDDDKGVIRDLDTIVVTATKTEHTLADVPDLTTVITSEEIEAQNPTSVMEVLRWIPGVTISEAFSGRGGDEYMIDGAPSDYTLILVDGNRVNGRYVLSEIPTSNIKRIEIVKGANSILYGSDALSGVINIITKKASGKLKFNLKGTYSYYEDDSNSNTQEVSAGFKLGKLRQFYTYGRKDIEGGEFKSDSFSGRFGIDLTEKTELKFDFKANQYDRENSHQERYDYLAELGWDTGDSSNLKVKFFYSDFLYESHVGGAVGLTTDDNKYDEEEIIYTRQLGKSHLLTAGYQRMNDKIDYSGPHRQYSESFETNSFILQDEIDVTESLMLVPAIRMNYHSQWANKLNPKFSLIWKANDTTSLRASYGTGFKAPTSAQLFRYTFHGRGSSAFWIMGNPNLEPEESKTYRVSVEKRIGNDFNGSIALFRTDFEQMIEGDYTGNFIDGVREYSYTNIAEAMTQGVEVNMKYYFMNDFLATLGYAYLDTEDKETGEELPDTIQHRLTPGISYINDNHGITAQISVEFVKFAEPDDDTGEDSHFMLHAGLSKTFFKRIKLWVNGDNLLDEEQDNHNIGISYGGRRITLGLQYIY